MTSKATSSKKINETRINKNEPPRFEQDVQEKPHDDGVKNKSSSVRERTTQPLVKPQQSSIPFPNRSLLMNKSRLKEAYTETMNKRCSPILLNKLPLKEKDPRSFTTPCQVLEKHKEAEDLDANHLSRFENPHMEVLTKREVNDKFSDEHLMVLKSKYNNDEPWYADFVNYIVGKFVPPNWTFKKRKRCVAGSETLEILVHCHFGPTGGHNNANVTVKKVYESEFYWPSVFKDANELRGDKDFKVGDKVLLYNSHLKMYPANLKSKWSGLNIVKMVYPYEAAEIIDKNGFKFKVNGQRLKKYYEGNIDKEDDEVIEFENGLM
nr:reverse transcriptase domain-containing protein [Tanacetum cinerariifolium]